MPTITIDTTSTQYQNRVTALQNLRTFLRPQLIVLSELPPQKQRQWAQNDPLLLEVFKLARMVERAMGADA